MKVGDTYRESVLISREMVSDFAQVSGDFNPLHLDDAYAAETPFKKPIAHGMLSGALISGALGTRFPGPGAVLLQMDLRFVKAVFVGETATFDFTVEQLRDDKPIATILCRVLNSLNELSAEGRCVLKVPRT